MALPWRSTALWLLFLCLNVQAAVDTSKVRKIPVSPPHLLLTEPFTDLCCSYAHIAYHQSVSLLYQYVPAIRFRETTSPLWELADNSMDSLSWTQKSQVDFSNLVKTRS